MFKKTLDKESSAGPVLKARKYTFEIAGRGRPKTRSYVEVRRDAGPPVDQIAREIDHWSAQLNVLARCPLTPEWRIAVQRAQYVTTMFGKRLAAERWSADELFDVDAADSQSPPILAGPVFAIPVGSDLKITADQIEVRSFVGEPGTREIQVKGFARKKPSGLPIWGARLPNPPPVDPNEVWVDLPSCRVRWVTSETFEIVWPGAANIQIGQSEVDKLVGIMTSNPWKVPLPPACTSC